MTSSYIIRTSASIIPTPPLGAPCSTGCFLYQRTQLIMMTSKTALLINNPITFLVIEMSNGRTSSPASLRSTIFPSYAPPRAIYSPSYSPSSRREEEKTCHPVLLCTITGNGILTTVLPNVAICHS